MVHLFYSQKEKKNYGPLESKSSIKKKSEIYDN